MFFDNLYFMLGTIQSLEALRRGQCGAVGMSIFILVSSGQSFSLKHLCDNMELLLGYGWAMWEVIPPYLRFLAVPYWDYLIGVS